MYLYKHFPGIINGLMSVDHSTFKEKKQHAKERHSLEYGPFMYENIWHLLPISTLATITIINSTVNCYNITSEENKH